MSSLLPLAFLEEIKEIGNGNKAVYLRAPPRAPESVNLSDVSR